MSGGKKSPSVSAANGFDPSPGQLLVVRPHPFHVGGTYRARCAECPAEIEFEAIGWATWETARRKMKTAGWARDPRRSGPWKCPLHSNASAT